MADLASTRTIDPHFLRRIQRLTLVSRQRLNNSVKGDRRSIQKGTSLEFMDYREYSPGDDLRQVDWNVYRRLGSLHLKLFEDEEVLTVHLLVDVSRSMDWGQPNKLEFACRLTGALGHIALSNFDRVQIAAIGSGVASRLGPVQGASGTTKLFEFLSRLPSSADTNLSQALRAYAGQHRGPGLTVIVSDLLSPEGCEAGILELVQRRHDVAVLHVLSPYELDPPVGGDVRLVDRETGRSVDVTLNQRAVQQYHRRLKDWGSGLTAFFRRHQIRYQRLSSASSLEAVLFQDLRDRGLLR